MGLAGIRQLVHQFHCSVHCGIITNGVICAGNIVVNGTRQTYTQNAVCRQICGTTERTVTADNDQTFQTVLFTGSLCFQNALFGAELCTSCGVQHSTAAADDSCYTHFVHRLNIVFQQTTVATLYAIYCHALFQSCTDNGTYRCIHARGIAAACQYTNRFNHKRILHSAAWQNFETAAQHIRCLCFHHSIPILLY